MLTEPKREKDEMTGWHGGAAHSLAKLFAALLVATTLCSSAQAQQGQSPFDKAVEDRHAGRLDQAIAELRAYLADHSSDADGWLNLGLSYTAKGDYADAESALSRGLQIAPDYADLRLAYARLAYFQSQRDEARKRLAPLLVTPGNQEAEKLLAGINAADKAAIGYVWRVDAAADYSFLSKGLPGWTEFDLALGGKLDDRTALSGTVEQTRRFDVDNTYLHLQLDRSIGTGSFFLGYGGSPNATYRAQHAVQAGIVAPPLVLDEDWRLTGEIDGSWALYPSGEVRSLQPLVTLSLRDDFSLSARYIGTKDETGKDLSGYLVRAEAIVLPGFHISAGYADAPDSSLGTTVEVRNVSVGVAYDFNDATTLRLAGAQETGRVYMRQDLTLSLTQRF